MTDSKRWYITPIVSDFLVTDSDEKVVIRSSHLTFSCKSDDIRKEGKDQMDRILKDATDPDRIGVIDLTTGKFHSLNDLKKNGGIL